MYLYEYAVEEKPLDKPEYFAHVTIKIRLGTSTLVLEHECHIAEEVGAWKKQALDFFCSPDVSMWLEEA